MFINRRLELVLGIALTLFTTAAAFAEPNSIGTLPDPALTPGAIRTTDRDDICNTKTSEVRDVSGSLKEQVRRRYGMTSKRDGWCNSEEGCEIDHLIPLVAGGSNEITNLWPQPYDRGLEWNAHKKDRLEAKVRKLICKQGVEPATIQQEIAKDWVSAYKKYVGASSED